MVNIVAVPRSQPPIHPGPTCTPLRTLGQLCDVVVFLHQRQNDLGERPQQPVHQLWKVNRVVEGKVGGRNRGQRGLMEGEKE